MHVCVFCSRRGHTTDKETTSLKDPLLVAPTDGHLLPAHPSDIASEAPAVCSHPSAVTQSTEPLEELSEVESSAEDGLDLHIKGGLPTGPPSAVIAGKGFSLCKNDSGVSDVLGAGSLQIDQAVTDIEGGADSSMLDVCDIPRPVEPIHSSVLQSNSQTQDDFNQKDSVWDSLPDSSALCQDMDGGALSVCAEAPMDVDVSAICHNDENIPGAACESPGFPEHQERDDSVTQQTPRDSTMQLLDDKGSENQNPLSEVVGSVSSNTLAQHVDDHCFSLATALKELHKLLVLSGQGPCRTAQDDAVSESTDTGHCKTSCVNGLSDDRLKQKEDASAENIVSDRFQCTKSEDGDGTPNQDLNSSSDADERFRSASGLDFTDSTDLHRTKAESLTSCSATAEASNTSKCLTSNQADCPSENQEPLSGSQTEKDLACAAPKITSEPSTEGPSPSQLPPSFLTSAVEQIVSAGFSVEDAVLALENADGNAELALLALLVKNIVVPT
ncbi:regulatory solute carrier protein family 1 member 1 [Spea bombifrons]|uniref:regulatory solute carrier protein family 1 member 1 n=1 Tax=Spea bombifrons TaxID=233779 RepID=UPI002349E729|nr:regulatory solute carrier protein family 1 member 1 [Spea bombifrons]